MKQNANSPSVSVNAWTDFYMGFSNIEEFVTNQQHLNYRVGMFKDHKIKIVVASDVGEKIYVLSTAFKNNHQHKVANIHVAVHQSTQNNF